MQFQKKKKTSSLFSPNFRPAHTPSALLSRTQTSPGLRRPGWALYMGTAHWAAPLQRICTFVQNVCIFLQLFCLWSRALFPCVATNQSHPTALRPLAALRSPLRVAPRRPASPRTTRPAQVAPHAENCAPWRGRKRSRWMFQRDGAPS